MLKFILIGFVVVGLTIIGFRHKLDFRTNTKGLFLGFLFIFIGLTLILNN
ncbi:hypothetical protein TUM17377_23510 [Shewanella chilikensis]|nr:hypothetical protein TUM17377_23510 [Shewanella chilikensis]